MLTFKTPVTAFNVASLRAMVINGAHKWPGATHLELENGSVLDLGVMKKAAREALAKTLLVPSAGGGAAAGQDAVGAAVHSLAPASGLGGGGFALEDVDSAAAAAAAAAGGMQGTGVKRVYRHMLDDDIVLMNRQPTLHKPSIMAHRVRVMRHWSSQQTIRFHYANCKTFNADFDGDEMNLHFLQDEISRAEAYTIIASPYQYLAPTSGAPLRGLIQDHNSISVVLTKRDTLLTRDQYCQLVMSGLQALPQYGHGNGISGGDGAHGLGGPSTVAKTDVPLLRPAILAPVPLWTGKQVISTILHALSAHMPERARWLHMDGGSKIKDGLWGEAAGRKDLMGVGDSAITIRGNDMLTGVIDKNSLGNASFGLTHAVYEVYGPNAAGALLSATGRLLTVYLQWAASTCGMDDLVLASGAEATRAALITQGIELGCNASADFAGVPHKPAVPAGAASKRGEVASYANPSWHRRVRLGIRSKLRGGDALTDRGGDTALRAVLTLDGAVKTAVSAVHSKVLDACLPYGLTKPFPRNQFSLMVQSGAKGATINHSMIAVGLGQQDLEVREARAHRLMYVLASPLCPPLLCVRRRVVVCPPWHQARRCHPSPPSIRRLALVVTSLTAS